MAQRWGRIKWPLPALQNWFNQQTNMRVLIGILSILLVILNCQLWLFADRGTPKVLVLQEAVQAQRTENARLKERNSALEAEVKSLKEGLEAIEERARVELGMIRQGETFFYILDDTPPAATPEPVPPAHE
jgi:cell division protein FtsB